MLAGSASADPIAQKVYDDVKAVRRVATAAGRDIPRDVLGRIVEEDVDELRGRQPDGSYLYAHYERDEAGRRSESFAVKTSGEDALDSGKIRGSWVYRLIIEVPKRRLLVARNRRVYIDRVELDYEPAGGQRRVETFPPQAWLDLGEETRVDFPDIARDAIATVYARTEEDERGRATVDLIMVEARLVDNADSRYFAAVQNAEKLQRAVQKSDADAIRRVADAVMDNLTNLSATVARSPIGLGVETVPPPVTITPRPSPAATSVSLESMPSIEIFLELRRIEDLLTGTEAERRDGLDKLHQLVRKLRPGPEGTR